MREREKCIANKDNGPSLQLVVAGEICLVEVRLETSKEFPHCIEDQLCIPYVGL